MGIPAHCCGITKKEWKFVLWISLAVILITSLPVAAGHFLAPAGSRFLGFVNIHHEDIHTYLSWTKQAQEGFFLFEEKYSTESQPRNIFLLYFLLTGLLARITGIPLVALQQLMRVLCGFTLLIVVYIFISYFVKDLFRRRLSFILAVFSSGFGAWFALAYHFFKFKLPPGWTSVDQLLPEAITFLTVFWLAHLSLAIAFMLMIYLFMLRCFETKRTVFCVIAGLMALALSFFHPYDLVTISAALGIYLVYKALIEKSPDIVVNLRSFFIFIILFLPGVAINYITLKNNPVVDAWLKHSLLSSGNVMGYFFGFGLVSIMAVIGAWRVIREKRQNLYFILCWVLAVSFLVYGPFSFQSRLCEGVLIPLSILAASGLFWVCLRLRYIKGGTLTRAGSIFILIFVLLVIPTNLMYFVDGFRIALRRGFPHYLQEDIYSALSWADSHVGPRQVILASRQIGSFIPPHTGSKVYIGHWAETIDHHRKEGLFRQFMQAQTPDSFRRGFLKENNISYLMFTDYEKRVGSFDPASAAFLSREYDNGSVAVFRVTLNDE